MKSNKKWKEYLFAANNKSLGKGKGEENPFQIKDFNTRRSNVNCFSRT